MKNVIYPGLTAGLGMTATSFAVSYVVPFIQPGLESEYQNIAMFRPWSDPLMQLFFAAPFLLGIAMAYVWDVIKNAVPGESKLSKGLNFGLGYFLVGTIPGMFITYSSFQVSGGMVLSWSLSGLFEAIVAGWVLAKLNPAR